MRVMVALSCSGLVKVFGSARAVDGVDLAIPRGSFYGLAGPNGAGKTTTIRMVTGLLKPDAGDAGASEASEGGAAARAS